MSRKSVKTSPELEKIYREAAEDENRLVRAMRLDGPRAVGKEGFDGEGSPDLVPAFFPDRTYLGEHGLLDLRYPLNWLWANERLGREPENTRRFRAGLVMQGDYAAANGSTGGGNMVFVDKSPVRDASTVSRLDGASRYRAACAVLDQEHGQIVHLVVIGGFKLQQIAKQSGMHPSTAKRKFIRALDCLAKHYGPRLDSVQLFGLER